MESKYLFEFQEGAKNIKILMNSYCSTLCKNIQNAPTTEREKKEFHVWQEGYCRSANLNIEKLNQIIDAWSKNIYRERMAINICKPLISNILQSLHMIDVLIREHKRITKNKGCSEENYGCMQEAKELQENITKLLKI